MFNIPNFPLINLRPIVEQIDNKIIITNWIGDKECEVKLHLEKFKWEIRVDISVNGTKKYVWISQHLYNFHDIITSVGEKLLVYNDLDTLNNFERQYTKRELGRSRGIKKWLISRIAKSVSKRVSVALRSIICKYVSPELQGLHKGLISCFGFKEYKNICYAYSFDKKFVEDNKYLMNDLKSGYRAALLYFKIPKWQLPSQPTIRDTFNGHIKPNEWIRLYLPKDEKPYPNLMKTLLKCPKIPLEKFHKVATKWKVPRIFENSLELKCWIEYSLKGHHLDWGIEARQPAQVHNIVCVQTSNKKQILKAKSLLEKHLREKIDFRTRIGIEKFVGFLYDYPFTQRCEVVSLMERSVQWHIQERQNAILKSIDSIKYESGRLTIKPPIPPPDNKNIVFLSNCQEVIEEGKSMSHCIGSYANKAFRGECYLFHIDYLGHKASAEVDSDGKLNQIHGPYNKDEGNKAVTYGKRILGQWCAELRKFLTSEPILISKENLKGFHPHREDFQFGEALQEIPF